MSTVTTWCQTCDMRLACLVRWNKLLEQDFNDADTKLYEKSQDLTVARNHLMLILNSFMLLPRADGERAKLYMEAHEQMHKAILAEAAAHAAHASLQVLLSEYKDQLTEARSVAQCCNHQEPTKFIYKGIH